MNPQLSIPYDILSAFCQKQGIKWLVVFGSALREDFGPESDADVFVEFEPERIPGLLDIARMELELSELFSGRTFGEMYWMPQKFSMLRDDEVRLRHMFAAAREALSFVQGLCRADLENGQQLVLALIKDIEIVGIFTLFRRSQGVPYNLLV